MLLIFHKDQWFPRIPLLMMQTFLCCARHAFEDLPTKTTKKCAEPSMSARLPSKENECCCVCLMQGLSEPQVYASNPNLFFLTDTHTYRASGTVLIHTHTVQCPSQGKHISPLKYLSFLYDEDTQILSPGFLISSKLLNFFRIKASLFSKDTFPYSQNFSVRKCKIIKGPRAPRIAMSLCLLDASVEAMALCWRKSSTWYPWKLQLFVGVSLACGIADYTSLATSLASAGLDLPVLKGDSESVRQEQREGQLTRKGPEWVLCDQRGFWFLTAAAQGTRKGGLKKDRIQKEAEI